MQSQNIQEYQSIRREIDSIKKCITDYMGFLILGIGAAFSVWGSITANSTGPDTIVGLGYSSLAISLVAVFMLFILIYKFISHNRYVGYTILLTQEVWDENSKDKYTSLILWELCVNLLRIKEVEVTAKVAYELEEINKEHQVLDTRPQISTLTAGLWFLFKALFRMQNTSSWGFPLTIVRIFVVVVWSCVAFGIYALSPVILYGAYVATTHAPMALLFLSVVLISQFILWLNIAQRIHSIMVGWDTVSSFAKRFRPVREQVLKEVYKVEADWVNVTLNKPGTSQAEVLEGGFLRKVWRRCVHIVRFR
jgi:hypothetical protein